MNRKRWEQIEPLLDKALEIESRSGQIDFLRDSCGNDDKLFVQVLFLLQAIDEAEESGFLDK